MSFEKPPEPSEEPDPNQLPLFDELSLNGLIRAVNAHHGDEEEWTESDYYENDNVIYVCFRRPDQAA